MEAFGAFTRRWAAVPIALVGVGLSFVAAGCVRLAAWLADIDIDDGRVE